MLAEIGQTVDVLRHARDEVFHVLEPRTCMADLQRLEVPIDLLLLTRRRLLLALLVSPFKRLQRRFDALDLLFYPLLLFSATALFFLS